MATLEFFGRVTATSGMLLFIAAVAGSLSYAMAIQMIPQTMASFLDSVGHAHGGGLF